MKAVPEQLASYKLASHATAQRAVMAARQALQGVPELATTSVDMDGAAQLSHAIAAVKFSQGPLMTYVPYSPSWGSALRVSKDGLMKWTVCRLLVMPGLDVTDKAIHRKLPHIVEVLIRGILIEHRINHLLVAGIVEAVAAAKRALSSHPLPDPFQPSGRMPCWCRSHAGSEYATPVQAISPPSEP